VQVCRERGKTSCKWGLPEDRKSRVDARRGPQIIFNAHGPNFSAVFTRLQPCRLSESAVYTQNQGEFTW
jgi:hypothetical protein